MPSLDYPKRCIEVSPITIITQRKGPRGHRPLRAGRIANGFLFAAGQIALNPAKATVFLMDMADLPRANKVYARVMGDGPWNHHCQRALQPLRMRRRDHCRLLHIADGPSGVSRAARS